jgi:hypothetical protein
MMMEKSLWLRLVRPFPKIYIPSGDGKWLIGTKKLQFILSGCHQFFEANASVDLFDITKELACGFCNLFGIYKLICCIKPKMELICFQDLVQLCLCFANFCGSSSR